MQVIFIALFIINLIAFFVPKRLSKIEMYSTSLFGLLWGHVVDMALDLKLKIYYYFDKGLQWADFLVPFLIYPSITILFLNYYPFAKGKKMKFYYILGWSTFSIIFEWLSELTGFFTHVEWKLWHSALVYPILFLILIGHLMIIKKLLNEDIH